MRRYTLPVARAGRGFFLWHLLLGLVLLSIATMVTIPLLKRREQQAKRAAVLGILGSVRTALSLYFTK